MIQDVTSDFFSSYQHHRLSFLLILSCGDWRDNTGPTQVTSPWSLLPFVVNEWVRQEVDRD